MYLLNLLIEVVFLLRQCLKVLVSFKKEDCKRCRMHTVFTLQFREFHSHFFKNYFPSITFPIQKTTIYISKINDPMYLSPLRWANEALLLKLD